MTTIYFKEQGNLRIVTTEVKINHEEALKGIIGDGFKPDDNRVMLTY